MEEHGSGEEQPLNLGAGLTRGALVGRAAAGAGVLAAGGLLVSNLPAASGSRPSPGQDARILRFALVFEHLQAAFYADALRRAHLTGELRTYAEQVGAQEREHAGYIERLLGDQAPKPPRFAFGDATTDPRRFARTARLLEDLGVAAYNGQAPNLTSGALRAAGRIVSVEARHAAWIRDILGDVPAPAATDTPISAQQAAAALDKTGFVR
jgi:hypothetical protein